MRTFYGVGVGPGDGELITVKGMRAIQKSDYIFIPRSKGKNISKEIASEYIIDQKIVELDFPMGEDNRSRYSESAKLIDEMLREGEIGVFLTLGDPMTYSTYIYLLESLKKHDIELETIPGISSFTMSASRLNIPLAKKNESIYIVDGELDVDILRKVDTVCILKVNKNKQYIMDILERESFSYDYVRRISQKDEEILNERSEILKRDDYMSLILGRRISK